MIKFLTEAETAKHLRISAEQLKRLRVTRRISYIPGRPLLFDLDDVENFAAARDEAKRVTAVLKVPGSPEYSEKKRQDAEKRHRMRIRVMTIHRDMARKHGRK